ncbi:MAG: preprotein translocase subunit YajC [Acidobacteria bacterium]|nr:preprotein translocase subunit YajC [Acidobacteriota bacterium]
MNVGMLQALGGFVAQAQDPEAVPPFAQFFGNPLSMMVIVFAIFYFLLIAPARKRQKALQQTISSLKSGDKVITTGGVLATVVAVTDRIVQLKISDQVKIDVLKSAVAGLQGEEKPGT